MVAKSSSPIPPIPPPLNQSSTATRLSSKLAPRMLPKVWFKRNTEPCLLCQPICYLCGIELGHSVVLTLACPSRLETTWDRLCLPVWTSHWARTEVQHGNFSQALSYLLYEIMLTRDLLIHSLVVLISSPANPCSATGLVPGKLTGQMPNVEAKKMLEDVYRYISGMPRRKSLRKRLAVVVAAARRYRRHKIVKQSVFHKSLQGESEYGLHDPTAIPELRFQSHL